MKKRTIYAFVLVASLSSISVMGQTQSSNRTDAEKDAWVKNNPEAYQQQLNELKKTAKIVTVKKTLAPVEVKKTSALKPRSQDVILLEQEIEANKNNSDYDLAFKKEKLRQAKTFEIPKSKK